MIPERIRSFPMARRLQTPTRGVELPPGGSYDRRMNAGDRRSLKKYDEDFQMADERPGSELIGPHA